MSIVSNKKEEEYSLAGQLVGLCRNGGWQLKLQGNTGKKTTPAQGVQGVWHCSQKGAELLIFLGNDSIGELESIFARANVTWQACDIVDKSPPVCPELWIVNNSKKGVCRFIASDGHRVFFFFFFFLCRVTPPFYVGRKETGYDERLAAAAAAAVVAVASAAAVRGGAAANRQTLSFCLIPHVHARVGVEWGRRCCVVSSAGRWVIASSWREKQKKAATSRIRHAPTRCSEMPSFLLLPSPSFSSSNICRCCELLLNVKTRALIYDGGEKRKELILLGGLKRIPPLSFTQLNVE